MADPAVDIHLRGLSAARGRNFWSRRPVIRMDLAVGAYEDICSADVPGFTDALLAALPGLRDHHCSIGAPGGFVQRLRRGTYAPHIIEHVALELQAMIGHEVSYGKTRGGDQPGEYTLIFEHEHEQVGLRAAGIALELVQRAFAGTIGSVDAVMEELRMLALTTDAAPLEGYVFCGITGGALRHETQVALTELFANAGDDGSRVVVDVSPAYLLRAGLPYRNSEMAILLDTALSDVAPRYQEIDAARQLVGTLIDGVRRGGTVICPAKEWELQDYARDADCRVAIFAADDDVTRRDRRVASVVARVMDGVIVIDEEGEEHEAGRVNPIMPLAPQVVSALVDATLGLRPVLRLVEKEREAAGAER